MHVMGSIGKVRTTTCNTCYCYVTIIYGREISEANYVLHIFNTGSVVCCSTPVRQSKQGYVRVI